MNTETRGAHARTGFLAWLDTRFRNPAAIYGLLVFATFITIASDHAQDSWDMLMTAGGTLAVFFIAHVFAHTLTDHSEHGLRLSTWRAIQHASGMLYASIPSAIVLVIGGFTGMSVDDVFDACTWVTIVVLGVLGYTAYQRRGARPLTRVLGAVGTAALGLLIVLLEYAIH